VQIGSPGYGDGLPDANAVGLTNTGRNLLPELMRRAVLIDVQHMSDKAVNEVLGLVDPGLSAIPGGGYSRLLRRGDITACARLTVDELSRNERCRNAFYPVLSSHGGLRSLAGDPLPGGGAHTAATLPRGQNENSRSLQQLRRIYQIGGMVGLGTVGGTRPFAGTYRYARAVDTVAGAGIAFGSDLNGGDGGAPPRLMEWSCVPVWERLPAVDQTFVAYRRPEGSPAPAYTIGTCGRPETVTFRRTNGEPALAPLVIPPNPAVAPRLPDGLRVPAPFDINTDGMANVGMYPDYLQDVRAIGLSVDEMTSLLQSAERFVQVWEKSCRVAAGLGFGPGDKFGMSDPSCLCDPGTDTGRRSCPPESPGMERYR
jgi:microsomal dipeptidase-like Zn-dependent dipeptidase